MVGTLLDVVDIIYRIYYWMIIIYIFMSWVPNVRESFIGEFLGKMVEPYLAPFRRIVPPLGMIDFSPIVALLALWLASFGLKSLLIFVFG
ncbi:MAG: YggT family protein [Paenibacillus macerans]|uniref:YGGT family protein n=2 Tax=Paenibacillus macerans TaxID=44252 RepID=A0A090ZGV1_PAEMA|nr:YggT family protein [Paenibacillus macerans]KFN09887.1 YGGT family protein [Paenibacillus macerans]MBS5911659.1 YggT family protein [Paenibacillus macerans]MDU7474580.1 YggT family protein [Paenibacillus macerans]MEC0141211.1 YggT family protein [Paenibacillus macerans]MEC0153399.1 YggT family protein [Paenibacillus macerans]